VRLRRDMFDRQSRCEVSKCEKVKTTDRLLVARGNPSLAPAAIASAIAPVHHQQSIHTGVLGTFLIFWRCLFTSSWSLGRNDDLPGWPFDSSDVPKNRVARTWDLTFGAHQWVKSKWADSTIPETWSGEIP